MSSFGPRARSCAVSEVARQAGIGPQLGWPSLFLATVPTAAADRAVMVAVIPSRASGSDLANGVPVLGVWDDAVAVLAGQVG
jgi:hypothetical protein